ncbi:hypothetical protein [Synechocystis sp. PCC 6714]|uniref:hypothetical protein n=1 Tax=Synechocystis sp. (strain PCC 6714) TaxID=1147 RepID=UPI0004253525|nr:hypothetical protein [Synechocystis sp. PCC 6714]AIE76237.1 hypothetical protein D082_50750 [Synechocystis sp. PCC 6714]
MTSNRYHFSLPRDFFCDGASYVLTSSSFGGSSLTPDTLSQLLRNADGEAISQLLSKGICLPLFFPGDCAFDGAVFIVGDLTTLEEQEWIGRIQSKLTIPCGKLLFVCGGGSPEDFEGAISGNGINGYTDYFHILEIPPGDYLVEVLAYVSSMSVDFYFEENESLTEWFYQTRPGETLPQWLETFKSTGYIGELSDELLTYIVHLTPLVDEPSLPTLISEIGWCGEFEFRRPEICPRGIPRSYYNQI